MRVANSIGNFNVDNYGKEQHTVLSNSDFDS